MDSSLKTWDIQPFTKSKNRQLKTFQGGKHGAEKGLLKCAWSPDGSMVTGGSSDCMVHIWDEVTTEEVSALREIQFAFILKFSLTNQTLSLQLYLLPGHTGCVNTVIFHPKENVIASGSSDKSIYVGELGQ
jgi:Prp8 binding protein